MDSLYVDRFAEVMYEPSISNEFQNVLDMINVENESNQSRPDLAVTHKESNIPPIAEAIGS